MRKIVFVIIAALVFIAAVGGDKVDWKCVMEDDLMSIVKGKVTDHAPFIDVPTSLKELNDELMGKTDDYAPKIDATKEVMREFTAKVNGKEINDWDGLEKELVELQENQNKSRSTRSIITAFVVLGLLFIAAVVIIGIRFMIGANRSLKIKDQNVLSIDGSSH